MPHVILNGQTDLNRAATGFAAVRHDGNGWIVKLKDIYVSRDGRTAVVDCTAVRSGFSQDFYVRIETKRNVTSLRVDPYMRIERNEGVQRAVAGVMAWLCGAAPELKMDKTNLPGDLLVAAPAETPGEAEVGPGL